MTIEPVFVDYYSVLQIDPDCSAKTLDAAYRHWAKMFHPDHPDTADVDKFTAVVEAYRVLRDPEQRSAYDPVYAANTTTGFFTAPAADPFAAKEEVALDDAEAHQRILRFLYKRRRENAQDPGVPGYYLQDMLNCSDDTYEFHRWYLKAKGFIEITEQGTVAITIEGIDHVISQTRTTSVEKLLIAQSVARENGAAG